METTRTSHREIGVSSIEHPADWVVEHEQFTLAATHGFTLWKPTPGTLQQCSGIPVLRVAVAPGLAPDQVEQTVQEKLDAYSGHLPVTRQKVSVGAEGLEGVAVGPIPGGVASWEVYVRVDDLVYLIRVYGEELGATGRRLLSSLEFDEPSQPLDSLGLPDANAPIEPPHPRLIELERTAREVGRAARTARDEGLAEGTQGASALGLVAQPLEAAILELAPAQPWEPRVLDPAAVPILDEERIYEGCWRAESTFFVQTQHGKYANSRWGHSYTGWSIVGRPNYWGNYTHGSLGYGRCVHDYYTNDKFAIDYPLGIGDPVFCPFKGGTVKWAGRWDSHINYGNMVVIEAVASNGNRYVSMSAHLSAVNWAEVYRGAWVDDGTIIGSAGDTGHPSVPVGEPHLHQAFYRNPNYIFISGEGYTGPPYGGQGLQVVYHHFVGDARRSGTGVYELDWATHYPDTSSVPSSGRYWISN